MTNRSSVVSRVIPGVLALAWSVTAAHAGPFPPVVDLAALNGTDGFVLNGFYPDSRAGRSVSSAGDINGDGIDDFLFGSGGSTTSSGEAYVVFGKNTAIDGPFEAAPDLAALMDGVRGFVINGMTLQDNAGQSVASAGDVNADGYNDIVIGVPLADPGGRQSAGQACVVYGGPGIGASGSFELEDLDGTNGFVINGVAVEDYTGWSVAGAGDVNNDGVDDLIISASYADPFGRVDAGRAYVVYGRDSLVEGPFAASFELANIDGTDAADGFVINGINPGDLTGHSVACARDVNGDGVDDLIIGAPKALPYDVPDAGAAYVVYGKDTPTLGPLPPFVNLWSLNWRSGFKVIRTHTASQDEEVLWPSAPWWKMIGMDVSSAGDINHDGFADLLFGTERGQRTFVLYGGPNVGKLGLVVACHLLGPNGFVVEGGPLESDPFIFGIYGSSVSAAGDINNDGIDDLLIGAPAAPVGTGRGDAYVVYGKDTAAVGGYPGTLDVAGLDGTTGFILRGAVSDHAGYSVASAGDVNGDGIGDMLIGAAFAKGPVGFKPPGKTFVVFGRSPVARAGDVDGDGLSNVTDFIILANHFGTGPEASRSMGDLSGDGFVDISDFSIFARDFSTAP